MRIGTTAFIILIVVMLLVVAGCASKQKAAQQPDKGVVEPAESKLITEITTDEDSESFSVWIKGNQLLTYTSVKQPFPLGVLLYFPETSLGNINTTVTPDSDDVGPINASELTDNGQTARIEITLKNDTSYEVSREDNDLKISFKKVTADLAPTAQVIQPEEEKPVVPPEPASAGDAEATLQSVTSTELENSISIYINADGTIKDYKSFTTNNPARIVFDLFNVKSPSTKEQTVPVNSQWVKSVRHYSYPDRLRVILDTTERYLSDFSANPLENGLVIRVGSKTEPAPMPKQEEMHAEVPAMAMATPAVDDAKPAWVNRIDFSSEEAGKSTLIIGTTKPIKYKIKKINDKKLVLNLYNTNIPDYRQRQLITTRFESAVDRITPFQTPKMKQNSMIAIELRESVPYVLEQVNDLLMLHFEASLLPPKTLDDAKLPPWKKVMAQSITAAPAAEPETAEGAMAAPQPTGKYQGEKIALNFFQTDIKNVFRILMDVSGKNFAIDKNVSGSVTLTFDKPVPWDQVLDLILRMNQLGMVFEGDIVRIATLATLEQESARRQAKLAADHKLDQQEKALEPLITEYIPVNYANASADILEHIQPLLSEGRGTVTVDSRNNQIIIKDVASVREQVKETIKNIDKVTPQVLIEARIVEASDTFTRDFGTQWQITGTPAQPGGESKGLLKIISSPKILTLDNTPATIKQGLSYPFNKLDADGNTTTEFKDIALELEVTPHVTPDGRISMDITIKNNELGDVINNQISFTTKEANTQLLVNDGDTVIIGGIRKARQSEAVSGVPGLKDIPLVGWLFKRKLVEDRMEELLIFITPRIVLLEQRNLG